MNTFLNLQEELAVIDTARTIALMLSERNLNERITARGHREQYAAMLQPHTMRKLVKGSYCSGCCVFSRYHYSK